MAERLNRGAVVARASELVDEIGLDSLTITKLGRALGIAPPGVYRHVADLDDLRSAIAQQAAHDLAAVLTTAGSGRSGSAALHGIADGLRRWAEQHPGRHAALQIAPEPGDADGQAAAERLIRAIADALREYALAGDDLTDAIRFVRSTVHGFVALELGGGFKQARDLDATFDRIVDALDGALSSWGGR
ncbi:hypothetical protein BMH32_00080 [Leucobacter sp. OLJS4]|uniref:TetR/AcrR family transcriptional regulator n=1 Tax=unclassified Leucobacter TaxID=2621730 RepID=UPI000C19F463|nr:MULTISPECIES: TetR/AcrR family transcriptional regulator [unclassified Leucobacter]PIJ23014.1 hypothetical protein BMH30_11790 [Leucobacter sp. OLES1]PII81475.1 hypothetical protein BMH25_13125 [Leucobacter sp. OLCALW19]PII86145.1 hypothetical protein BMH26_13545 [Leucobacter sp. OLTLW20]PII90040.1 hypothetical protein BMH27_11710 [Leucobacter sp. OLAS13]PII97073.1 hypothetical protein BMH29_12395 [Leucobacter sp. OLDS2]